MVANDHMSQPALNCDLLTGSTTCVTVTRRRDHAAQADANFKTEGHETGGREKHLVFVRIRPISAADLLAYNNPI